MSSIYIRPINHYLVPFLSLLSTFSYSIYSRSIHLTSLTSLFISVTQTQNRMVVIRFRNSSRPNKFPDINNGLQYVLTYFGTLTSGNILHQRHYLE